MIDFGKPDNLLLLLVVAAMAGAVLALLRWRLRARQAFAGPQAGTWPSSPIGVRLLLLLLAAVLVVLAAAQPRWGSKQQLRETQGSELVIVLDVSQSMQGTDVEPTRIKLAQEELKRLVDAERGNRIGLILFAGTAVIR